MSLPSLTVVTPSYNQGKFIEATLRSVLDQAYPALEYWVMDGDSTDETKTILKRYSSQLRWVSQPDQGQSDALHQGFSRATGEILGWLNSDDLYLPGALESVGRYFQDHPDVDLLYGRGIWIDAVGRFLFNYPTEPFSWRRLAQTCFFCQPAVFFRASLYRRAGPLRAGLHFGMDYDFWIRSARLTTPHFLPQTFAATRIHENAKTFSGRISSHREIIQIVKYHFGVASLSWVVGLAWLEWAHWLKVEVGSTKPFQGRSLHWPSGGLSVRGAIFFFTVPFYVAWTYFRLNHRLFTWDDWKFIFQKLFYRRRGSPAVAEAGYGIS